MELKIFIVACLLFCNQNNAANRVQQATKDEISYDQLLHIARNGLPPSTSKKKIIVVGAGMAGLSAGYVLEQAGHEVVILEASGRIGGRVHTYKDKTGWNVELGAMRIPHSHKILWHYIEDVFGLEYKGFASHDPEAFVYVNGIRKKYKDYLSDPDSLNYDLPPEEKGKTAEELFEVALQSYIEDFRLKGLSYIHENYDHMSILEVLVTKTNLSDSAISMIGTILNLGGLFRFSVSEVLDFYVHFDKHSSLSGGMETLPKAFLKAMNKTHVLLNCQVRKITQSSNEVVAEYYRQSESVSEKANISADYLIMTPSAPVVSFIEFKPRLSIKKKLALDNSYHDDSTKISLAFSTRFWEKEGIHGGHTVTDLPARLLYYFAGNSNFSGGVISSYTWGYDSQLLTGLGESECLRIVLDNIATIHGQYIRQYFIGGVIKHWLLDKFTLGAYSFLHPLQKHLNSQDAIRANHGLVWFAGEYTDLPAAWIETAVKSGLRAALNINKLHSDVASSQHTSKTEL